MLFSERTDLILCCFQSVLTWFCAVFRAGWLDSVLFSERAQLKKELEDEYKSMLEKNKMEMENMEKEFQKRLEDAQKEVSTTDHWYDYW